MLKSLLAAGLLLYPLLSAAAEKKAVSTLKAMPSVSFSVPTEIYALSMGPSGKTGTLRISLVNEEIYSSLYVEIISFSESEEGSVSIKKHYYFSGFDIAKELGIRDGYLSNLKLSRWKRWNRFEMQSDQAHFTVSYHSDGTFTAEKKK